MVEWVITVVLKYFTHYTITISGCQDCQCSKSGSVGNDCDKHTGQCRCKPGVIGKKCDNCPPQSIFFANDAEDLGVVDGLFKDEEDCIFCISEPSGAEQPPWMYQFDYNEGCFSCHSIKECKYLDQKGCPSACLGF